tara:strand:+ start:226 stop:1356 length:1131 start_codon:yes stop_codon:yes gene_type:complete
MSNPTFGYLGSITPSANQKVVLHTADAGKLVEGKLTVTHKNPFPTRIRVGVSSGTLDSFDPSAYIIYDQILAEGESYESADIYYANNQNLVIESDKDNTSFIITGQMLDDPTDKSGFVHSLTATTTKNDLVLYTVPPGEEANLNIFVTNQSSDTGRIRMGVGSENATTLDPDEYIEYNLDIDPRQTYQRTDIKARGDQSIIVWSDNPGISFAAYAKFNYTIITTDLSLSGSLDVGTTMDVGSNLTVGGTTTITGKLTTSDDLDVAGNTDIRGTLTGYNSSDVLKYSLSNQTGLLSTQGSITSVGGISTSGTLEVGANKFSVDPSTGNITGTSGSFSSNLDLLNNKVTNLAEPTEQTDAVNRRYVDSKITAFSIALG